MIIKLNGIWKTKRTKKNQMHCIICIYYTYSVEQKIVMLLKKLSLLKYFMYHFSKIYIYLWWLWCTWQTIFNVDESMKYYLIILQKFMFWPHFILKRMRYKIDYQRSVNYPFLDGANLWHLNRQKIYQLRSEIQYWGFQMLCIDVKGTFCMKHKLVKISEVLQKFNLISHNCFTLTRIKSFIKPLKKKNWHLSRSPTMPLHLKNKILLSC